MRGDGVIEFCPLCKNIANSQIIVDPLKNYEKGLYDPIARKRWKIANLPIISSKVLQRVNNAEFKSIHPQVSFHQAKDLKNPNEMFVNQLQKECKNFANISMGCKSNIKMCLISPL